MIKRVVIAIDSMKGSLSSGQSCQAVALGVKEVSDKIETTTIAISDGGEGMVEALLDCKSDVCEHKAKSVDALGGDLIASYLISTDKTAYIESAKVCGLALIEPSLRDPMKSSSYGLGLLIKDALDQGCRKFVIGLGGSATNDCGAGMLSALGYCLLDNRSIPLYGNGEDLSSILSIDDSGVDSRLFQSTFTIASDVKNPLYGENGAAYIFAPQKGATPRMVVALDKGLRDFAKVINSYNGYDLTSKCGAGAAGGLGAAFVAFLNADIESGIDIMLDAANFDNIVKEADLVITGEGRSDKQTIMGKAPYGIMKRAAKMGVSTIILSGAVDDEEILREAGFEGVFSILRSPISLKEAMDSTIAQKNLQITTTQIINLINKIGKL